MDPESEEPKPDAPQEVPPPPPSRMQGGVLLLTCSAMLLATTVMMPWYLIVEDFGGEDRVQMTFPYESWEGRITVVATLVILLFVALAVSDPTPAARARRCVLLLPFAITASIAPSVYIWRITMKMGMPMDLAKDRLETISPGIVLLLLALMGIGFGASMTHRRERARVRSRVEKT